MAIECDFYSSHLLDPETDLAKTAFFHQRSIPLIRVRIEHRMRIVRFLEGEFQRLQQEILAVPAELLSKTEMVPFVGSVPGRNICAVCGRPSNHVPCANILCFNKIQGIRASAKYKFAKQEQLQAAAMGMNVESFRDISSSRPSVRRRNKSQRRQTHQEFLQASGLSLEQRQQHNGKLSSIIRVLQLYRTELSFADFQFACHHSDVISNFGLMMQVYPLTSHDVIQEQVRALKVGKQIWKTNQSRFYLVQMAIVKEVLALLGVPSVNDFGRLIQHSAFVQHEKQLLHLTKLCALAGGRFFTYHKLTSKIPGNRAVTAVRRELNSVWGTTLEMIRKRNRGEKLPFHTFLVQEHVKRLAECSDHSEHLRTLEQELCYTSL